jgi:regulator of extracellular matrix RemA (YlzA/DUF370 family)
MLKKDELPLMLNVGFANMIMTHKIIAILDIKVPHIKRHIALVQEERPRSVYNFTRGRKALSLILLEGDRYIISCIPRKNLCRRIGFIIGQNEETANSE